MVDPYVLEGSNADCRICRACGLANYAEADDCMACGKLTLPAGQPATGFPVDSLRMLIGPVQSRRPLPRRAALAAIGQAALTVPAGLLLLVALATRHLPVSDYAGRILQQGDGVGYCFLISALLLPSAYLFRAGLRCVLTGHVLTGATLARLVGVGILLAIIGAMKESAVLHDLRSDPASVRGMVTASYSTEEQKGDTIVTVYHLTVGGRTFTTDVADMGDLYSQAKVGRCTVVSYGPYTHALANITPCPAR